MIMRVNKIVTHLRPEDAYTLIEFLDQLRDVLMETYGDDVRVMLQEAILRQPAAGKLTGDDDALF